MEKASCSSSFGLLIGTVFPIHPDNNFIANVGLLQDIVSWISYHNPTNLTIDLQTIGILTHSRITFSMFTLSAFILIS